MTAGDVYKTRISILFYLLTAIFIGVSVYGVYCAIVFQNNGYLIALATPFPVIILTVYCYLRIKYTFKEHFLLIEGVSKKRYEVRYSSISQIERSLSIQAFNTSNTALTFSQIMIRCGGGQTFYVSPVRKQEFIKKLEAKVLALQVNVENEEKRI